MTQQMDYYTLHAQHRAALARGVYDAAREAQLHAMHRERVVQRANRRRNPALPPHPEPATSLARPGRTHLTADQVREIRRAYAKRKDEDGIFTKLGREFAVSREAVSKLLRGKTHRSVE